MDKEDCIEALLSTLRKPQWKQSNSVTDWDLGNVLWRAGILFTPDQMSALLSDVRRRGLITSRERRCDNRIAALWGVKLTASGEEWLNQRAQGGTVTARRALSYPPSVPQAPLASPTESVDSAEPDSAQEGESS
ncbi:MAG TPA: hypothetical protein VHS28_04250 [Chloroflexota bacterium]|nr:hypothetical protein [Chloroflexota bacterium]